MKILVDKEYVDFEAPVYMSEEQQNKFIKFMKTMFHEIEVVNVMEKKRFVGEKEIEIKPWTVEDHYQLLSPENNEELASKMDRTEMGVSMKRADFVPEFYKWAKNKGYTKISKEIVQEFLDQSAI